MAGNYLFGDKKCVVRATVQTILSLEAGFA
jgi:hypothetical protein